MIRKLDASNKKGNSHIRILYPGLELSESDTGYYRIQIGIKKPDFLFEADHSFGLPVPLFRFKVSSGNISEHCPSM